MNRPKAYALACREALLVGMVMPELSADALQRIAQEAALVLELHRAEEEFILQEAESKGRCR